MTENYDGSNEPSALFNGEIIVIDTLDAADAAVAYLSQQSILGFDTETKPAFSSADSRIRKVALLQLADDKRAYLFRLNKTGLPKNLAKLLGNKQVMKIGAAIHDDIRKLRKLRLFQAENFVDLQNMVADYGIEHKSLKKMAEIVLQINISKGQRLTNWESETLTVPQQRYAATDAWVCREIYLKLTTVCLQTKVY
ncbi:MAG: 3'-5' exonuclease domain-containing protein 2 [Prevotellaceae bacterium]|nr:3'-5' exonuclease domain-containing protein 2 [Prevotellaceae bacterium]